MERGFQFSPFSHWVAFITYDIIPSSVTSEQFLQFLCKLVVCVVLICSVFQV